jgi:hypothetical protein
MAIGSSFLEILGRLRLAGLARCNAPVMEIGAQQLSGTFLDAPERVQRLGMLFGVARPLSLPTARRERIVGPGGLPNLLDPAAPAARIFWEWLGFDYAAIDIDGSPGSIPLDLNFDSVPAEATGKYPIVTNFGTTEHVANQLNAFKIIHDLTAPGGVMIHELPAQGSFNHGLINYNFKFFWMLARSNDYKFFYARYDEGEAYEFPKNILEFIGSVDGVIDPATFAHPVADCGIAVVLQKGRAIPFVPPLDVDTGTQTDNEALRRRYWTVFDPDALKRMADPEAAAASVSSASSPSAETAACPITRAI